MTLKTNQDIYTNPLGIDLTKLQWGNFAEALNGAVGARPSWDYLANSVVATVLSLFIGITVGTLAGYGLTRAEGKVAAVMSRTMIILFTVPILST